VRQATYPTTNPDMQMSMIDRWPIDQARRTHTDTRTDKHVHGRVTHGFDAVQVQCWCEKRVRDEFTHSFDASEAASDE